MRNLQHANTKAYFAFSEVRPGIIVPGPGIGSNEVPIDQTDMLLAYPGARHATVGDLHHDDSIYIRNEGLSPGMWARYTR